MFPHVVTVYNTETTELPENDFKPRRYVAAVVYVDDQRRLPVPDFPALRLGDFLGKFKSTDPGCNFLPRLAFPPPEWI